VYSFGSEMSTSGFAYGLFDIGENRTNLSCFSGACFMARAQVIKRNRFEDNFFLYYEEPDISARVLMDGLKIGRYKEATCYHLENYSSPKKKAEGIVFRQFYAIQNRWYMLGKFWPLPLLVLAMPLNLFHLFYNVSFFLAHGKFKETRLLYLSLFNLVQGRKRYQPASNHKWTKRLRTTGLHDLISLQKKVYK